MLFIALPEKRDGCAIPKEQIIYIHLGTFLHGKPAYLTELDTVMTEPSKLILV